MNERIHSSSGTSFSFETSTNHFHVVTFSPLLYDLTLTWKPWPNIKTNIKSSKVERAAVCAIFSSLQAISKKISAIKNCEITRWEKVNEPYIL